MLSVDLLNAKDKRRRAVVAGVQDAGHLGIVARGPGAAEVLRELAASSDRRLLLVSPEAETVWGWLGGGKPSDAGEVLAQLRANLPSRLHIALGEYGKGLAAWRLTHQQAKAALRIAIARGTDNAVRYVDVALVASFIQDELLSTSLDRLFLEPLEQERDGGKAAFETLCAYFTTGRNVASAAARLGVSRQTVTNRLRAAEGRLGRPVQSSELEAALYLYRLGEKPRSPMSHEPNDPPCRESNLPPSDLSHRLDT